MLVELQFFFSAHRLMVIYICTKFLENILDSISYSLDMIFRWKISKGHNSVKNVGGVSFFVLLILHIVWWWFIFVPSFMKISWTVSELWSGHEKLTDGQMEGTTKYDQSSTGVKNPFQTWIKLSNKLYPVFLFPLSIYDSDSLAGFFEHIIF